MEENAGLSKYLESMQRGLGEMSRLAERGGVHPFITISRQAGAGGRFLADVLLQEMRARGGPLFEGWQSFDQALCRVAAENPKLNASLHALLSEECRGEIADAMAQFFTGALPRDAAHIRVFETVRKLASVGRAVIVGRGGVFLTRGLRQGVHVRLVAPEQVRRSQLMRSQGLGVEEAERYLREQDEARARLVRLYFHKDISDPLNYDMVFNTARVPMENIARVLLDAVAERARAAGREAR